MDNFQIFSNLFGDSWKLHHMECFIKHGSTHVNVDNHGSPSFSTEKSLKQSSEFTFTEWDNKGLIPTKINEKFVYGKRYNICFNKTKT